MRKLLNTLFVQTQGTYLRLDHETLKVDVERKTVLQVPLHHLSGMVVFGNVLLSPFLIHRFSTDGKSIVWLTRSGRFKARVSGPTTGNVLLRRAQHALLTDEEAKLSIAKRMVAGKLQNARTTLLRSAREAKTEESENSLRAAAADQANGIQLLARLRHLDEVRGVEGDAARSYFGAFSHMIRNEEIRGTFRGRNRRPPLDPVNALLSFVYGMVRNECSSALEVVGLDPQVGYLHGLRPGRQSLALDLMEEFRPILADRFIISLLNLGQIAENDFIYRPGGAVELSEDARKTLVLAYQRRKQDEVKHPMLKSTVPIGLLPQVQARLLARHIRGDAPHYQPYLYR